MTLTMRLGVRSYDIVVRRGALARVNQLINLNRKVLVVTDEGVPRSYVETILAQCGRGVEVCVPQGEGSKSFACLERILTTMLEAGFGRSDAVLALGGGVVGDLAGFAAACWGSLWRAGAPTGCIRFLRPRAIGPCAAISLHPILRMK